MTATMPVEPPDCSAAASDARIAHGSVSTALRGAQSLNPTTSLSMVYLRAFARENATQPGKVLLSRKAMHMLRMHWAHVRAGAA